jgi:hypothetical protein
MKAKLYIVAIMAALMAMTAQAQSLQSIYTYQPPLGVDAGCGKGKPIYTLMPSGSKVCKLPKKGVAK